MNQRATIEFLASQLPRLISRGAATKSRDVFNAIFEIEQAIVRLPANSAVDRLIQSAVSWQGGDASSKAFAVVFDNEVVDLDAWLIDADGKREALAQLEREAGVTLQELGLPFHYAIPTSDDLLELYNGCLKLFRYDPA